MEPREEHGDLHEWTRNERIALIAVEVLAVIGVFMWLGIL